MAVTTKLVNQCVLLFLGNVRTFCKVQYRPTRTAAFDVSQNRAGGAVWIAHSNAMKNSKGIYIEIILVFTTVLYHTVLYMRAV